MRMRKLLSALLPVVVACSEDAATPTDIKPSFASGCVEDPTVTAEPPTATQPPNKTGAVANFLVTNNCSVSAAFKMTASKSGQVTFVSLPNPSQPTIGATKSQFVTITYNTGAAGSGQVTLTAALSTNLSISGVGSMGVTVTAASAVGTTYGIAGLKPDTIPTGWGWTGGYLGSKNLTTEKTLLAAARSHSPRIRMIFSMTGGDEQIFKNANGSFNLQAWKDTLDRVASPLNADGTSSFYAGLLPYIKDTTYLAVRLLDDPANFTPPVSFSDMEAMAAYSKKRFPLLPTAIRDRPTVLKSKAPLCGTCSGGHQPYAQLDMGWAQYRSDRGKAADYRDAEISAASDEKLGVILGINLNDGGPPIGSNVPLDSVLSWGTEFLRPVKSDYACALFLWDNTYPNLASSVFNTLATMAANHVKAPCTRRP